MATVLQQVLDRLDAILAAHTPAGTTLARDRADAFSRDEAPAINVLAREGDVAPLSEMDVHTVHVELRIHVRSESGAAAAEALHAPVHQAVATDAVLAALCEKRRLAAYSFERAEADTTLLIKAARYTFTYMVSADTL